jgi:hypothetical protein
MIGDWASEGNMITVISQRRIDYLSFSCQALIIGIYMSSVCSRACQRVLIALFKYDVYATSKTKPGT